MAIKSLKQIFFLLVLAYGTAALEISTRQCPVLFASLAGFKNQPEAGDSGVGGRALWEQWVSHTGDSFQEQMALLFSQIHQQSLTLLLVTMWRLSESSSQAGPASFPLLVGSAATISCPPSAALERPWGNDMLLERSCDINNALYTVLMIFYSHTG